VILLRRAEWSADTNLARRGHSIGPRHRSEVIVHHTVIVDSDATANEWETLDEIKSSMRRLQKIRPDLGLDVPYNFVAFCMSDGGLVLCEGRGAGRTGAHTRNHNRSALGIAFHGDFENKALPGNIDAQLSEFAEWLRTLRNNQGFRNLGGLRPDNKQVWGHRDSRGANTVCPGQKLYSKLTLIRFIDDEDETAMDKSTWKLVQRALQAQNPPLYAGKKIDGKPGRNTDIATRAFEKRMALDARGVIGNLNDPVASIWPATRELLFATAAADMRTA
jgi:hypothetical protein